MHRLNALADILYDTAAVQRAVVLQSVDVTITCFYVTNIYLIVSFGSISQIDNASLIQCHELAVLYMFPWFLFHRLTMPT
jgi:hypothetical protein